MRLGLIHISQETCDFNPVPTTLRDFEAFARQTGNALVEHGESDGTFWFLMRRR